MVKLITKKVNINTKDVKTRLDDVVRSYDLDDTKIEIKVINSNVDLTDAKIHCVFKYFVNGKRYAIEKIYTDTTKDAFYIQFPEELKGITGRVYIGVYADLGEQRIDIKDMEIYLDNSIIDQDIDFVAINYFESFENVISEYKDKSTIEINEIKKLKNDAEESHDIAIDRINEYIIDTKKLSEKVMEEIDETSKAIESAKESFESDVNDFENIKDVAKNTALNAVSEIENVKNNALDKMTENENSVTVKYESLVNLFEDSSAKVKVFSESFEKNLKKAGMTITVAEDFKKRIGILENQSNESIGLKEKVDELEKRPTPQPYDDKPIIKRIETLEQKDDKDTVYNDTEIKEEVKNAKSKLDELSEKVASLESRTDNDTVYDDTSVKQSISSVDTKVDKLSAKVTELEQRPSSEAYDDTELSNRVTALERKQDKDTIYDDSEIKRRITALEQKEDHDTIYNDTEIKNRLVALEQKEDKDTVYDDSRLVERIESLESDDTTIKERISALEEKPDKDTIYDDTSLKAQIVELESKLQSLNTVKRPPYGYRLNRKTDPWELIFDNGCILTFPLDTNHEYYGWDEIPIKISNTRPYNASPYSTPEMIMWYVKGHRTVEYLKTSNVSSYTEFINCKLKNPINDSSLYNFDNAFGDASDDTLIGKRNFVKLLYELDALIEDDLLSVGVTKK